MQYSKFDHAVTYHFVMATHLYCYGKTGSNA